MPHERERDIQNILAPGLMRGAPLLPAGPGDEGPKNADTTGGGYEAPPSGEAPVPPAESGAGGANLAAQGKAAVREVIVSGKAEAALSTVANAAEKTKEGVEVLLQILGLAKTKLEGGGPGTEGLPNPLSASQVEMLWNLIKVPEFQYLAASMLARMLAD
jgi:hypothetical protein